MRKQAPIAPLPPCLCPQPAHSCVNVFIPAAQALALSASSTPSLEAFQCVKASLAMSHLHHPPICQRPEASTPRADPPQAGRPPATARGLQYASGKLGARTFEKAHARTHTHTHLVCTAEGWLAKSASDCTKLFLSASKAFSSSAGADGRRRSRQLHGVPSKVKLVSYLCVLCEP